MVGQLRRRVALWCAALLVLAALSPLLASAVAHNIGAVYLLRALGRSGGALFDPVGIVPAPSDQIRLAARWFRRGHGAVLPGAAPGHLALLADLALGHLPHCAAAACRGQAAPSDPLVGATWAIAQYRADRPGDAIRIWQLIGAGRLLGGFAEHARVSGRSEAALEAAGLALAVDPGSAARWEDLATALADAGRGDDALEAYQRATALGAISAPAYHRQALLLHQSGRTAEALEALDRALALHEDGPYFLAKADILIASGNPEAADGIYARLQESDWNPAWVLAKRGENLARQGRVPEGMALVERATELAPDNREIWFTLGLADWYYAGDLASSARAFERVVQLDPKYPLGHVVLAQVYEIMGRPDEARREYRLGLELAPGSTAALDGLARLRPTAAGGP